MSVPTRPARITAFTASTASTVAVPARARTALMVINASDTADLAFSFGTTPAAVDGAGSITLQPYGFWSAAGLGFVPSDAINIISLTDGAPVTIIE